MGGTDPANGSSSAETEELARLRAERDALRAQLTKKEKQERGGRGRRTLVAVLVLLSCLAFTLAVPAVWTRRTLSDTDRYVATVAPIIENESVTDALSQRISGEVITVLDPETVAADALPERRSDPCLSDRERGRGIHRGSRQPGRRVGSIRGVLGERQPFRTHSDPGRIAGGG